MTVVVGFSMSKAFTAQNECNLTIGLLHDDTRVGKVTLANLLGSLSMQVFRSSERGATHRWRLLSSCLATSINVLGSEGAVPVSAGGFCCNPISMRHESSEQCAKHAEKTRHHLRRRPSIMLQSCSNMDGLQ